MDPLSIAMIAGQGLNTLSGMLSGSKAAKASQAQTAEDARQFNANLGQRQKDTALSATQMDPLYQQKQRQKNALISQMLSGYQPVKFDGKRFTGGLNGLSPEMIQAIKSYFSPEARAAAENAFHSNASIASNNQYARPNLGEVGYGAAAPALPVPSTPGPGYAAAPRRMLLKNADDFGGTNAWASRTGGVAERCSGGLR